MFFYQNCYRIIILTIIFVRRHKIVNKGNVRNLNQSIILIKLFITDRFAIICTLYVIYTLKKRAFLHAKRKKKRLDYKSLKQITKEKRGGFNIKGSKGA